MEQYLSRSLLVLAVVMGLPIAAAAQEKEAAVHQLAVVDVDEIERRAAATQDIRRQISEYRETLQAEFREKDAQLRTASQELVRQRTILSPEAFADERRKFEAQVVDTQRNVQVQRQALDKAMKVALKSVEVVLDEVIREVVKANGITLLLRREALAFSVESLDITGTLLAELDIRLPRVEVPKPGIEATQSGN
jgi:Skp family chaperone for outer membrane proteins